MGRGNERPERDLYARHVHPGRLPVSAVQKPQVRAEPTPIGLASAAWPCVVAELCRGVGGLVWWPVAGGRQFAGSGE